MSFINSHLDEYGNEHLYPFFELIHENENITKEELKAKINCSFEELVLKDDYYLYEIDGLTDEKFEEYFEEVKGNLLDEY
jgi:hypothetical protein